MASLSPIGRELFLQADQLIVSKTDLTGKITYANDVFMEISGYAMRELLGAPHSILRHPDMPRAVFALLWQRIQAGHEVFAYVKNLTKSGDFYWVFAHVTPTLGAGGKIIGYHSNRRAPARAGLEAIKPLYAELLRLERSGIDRGSGLAAAKDHLARTLAASRVSYDEFVFQITP